MKLLSCSLLLLTASFASLRADTMTLGAQKDATIFQNNVNNSNGAGPGISAGTNGTNSPRRTLIQFNIAASLPANAIITDVQFRLVLGQVAGSGGGSGGTAGNRTISLYDLAADWGEGSTGASTSIGGSGQGAAANTGDATWNARLYSATSPSNWTTSGGDHAATASSTLTLTSTTVGTAFTWSSPGLVSDVQSWLNAPAANHGWELINADETSTQTFFAFYSREGQSISGVTADQLPQLTITYVPEPGTWLSSIGVGVIGLLAFRRRFRRAAGRLPG